MVRRTGVQGLNANCACCITQEALGTVLAVNSFIRILVQDAARVQVVVECLRSPRPLGAGVHKRQATVWTKRYYMSTCGSKFFWTKGLL